MKKLLLSLSCLLLLAANQSFAGDDVRDPELVGTWTGIDNKNIPGGYIFNKNGTVILIQEDQHMDMSKEGGSSMWRTDTSKTPGHLDILLNFSDGGSAQFLMIYKLLQKNQLLVRHSLSRERPTAFLELSDETQIVLYRKN